MIKGAIALRYSKALFNLDHKNIKNMEQRIGEFELIEKLLKSDPKLLKLLQSPQISLGEKETILKKILSDKVGTQFFHFLLYLINRRRLNDLEQIGLEYRRMIDNYLGIWEAKIITAIPIEGEVEQKLKNKLESVYLKKIKIKKEVDPKIIGGAIVLVNSEMIDWSVIGRLKQIKDSLLATKI